MSSKRDGLGISRRSLLVGASKVGAAIVLGTFAYPINNISQALAATSYSNSMPGTMDSMNSFKHTVVMRTGAIGIPEELDQHLNTYETIGLVPETIDHFVSNIGSSRLLSGRHYILTIWGAGKGDLEGTLNLLDSRSLQATFFIPPNELDTTGQSHTYLDPHDVVKIANRGHDVGLLTDNLPHESASNFSDRLRTERHDLEAILSTAGPSHSVDYIASKENLYGTEGKKWLDLSQNFDAGFTHRIGREHTRPYRFDISTLLLEVTPEPKSNYEIEIPVLMYHRVTAGPTKESIWVSQNQLRTHFSYLRREGFESVNLDQVVDYMEEARPIPEKSFVAIFDDNWPSFFTFAAPIAREYGFQITQGLIAHGGYNEQEEYSRHAKLAEEGVIDVQSHSVTHPLDPAITALSDERLRFELAESKRRIENGMQQPVNHFIAPGGSYSNRAIQMAEDIGYRSYITAWGGQGVQFGDNPLAPMPRVQVLWWVDEKEFARRIMIASDGK